MLLAEPALAASPYYLGDYPVGRQTFELVDPDRNGRTLRLDVWYPATVSSEPLTQYPSGTSRIAHQAPPANAGAGHPLIVYSHGHGMTSTGNTVYPESLASHGFIVAAPNHTGNVDGDLSSGEKSTVERPADVSFVIDTMLAKSGEPGDAFAGTIDAEKIGVSGFSFGGFTTMATVTGVTQGGVTVPPDPRVKAILPIARGSFYAEPIQPADVKVPTLSIVGEDDGLYGQVTGDLGRISATDKYLAVIVGADHADVGTSFCQQSPEGKACANDFDLATISQYGVAFFSRFLEGDTSFDAMLTAQYAAANFPQVEFWRQAIVDTNSDGRATLVEFGRLKENFGREGTLANYSRGDFNRDRRIDLTDFGLLKLNFSAPPAAVPEPSSFILAGFGLAGALVFWRGRSRRHMLERLKSRPREEIA
jgi:predicted dienelactone hydrolase